MKKVLALVLLLAIAVLAFSGCKRNKEDPDADLKTFVQSVTENKPAKVTTIVNYSKGDDALNGKYTSIYADEYIQFDYEYDRFATVEEEAASRIVKSKGTAYYKDGLVAVTEGDEKPSEWAAIPASGIQANFDLMKGKDCVTFNEDKSSAAFALNAETALAVLGVDFRADGNVALNVSLANGFLNNVKIEYKTAQGAQVLVNSSYTYAAAADDLTVEAAIAKISALLRTMNPTKTVTETTQQIGTIVLNTKTTLTIGTVDAKTAATYVKVADELSDLSKPESVTTTTTTYDYIEGMGTRVNGGEWNNDIASFIPTKGFLKLNLDPELIEDEEYENGELSFTVEADNVEDVLGALLGEDDELDCDVYVTIVTAGGNVTGIELEYTVEQYDSDAINQNDVDVVVETSFFYDLETITIE